MPPDTERQHPTLDDEEAILAEMKRMHDTSEEDRLNVSDAVGDAIIGNLIERHMEKIELIFVELKGAISDMNKLINRAVNTSLEANKRSRANESRIEALELELKEIKQWRAGLTDDGK